MIRMAVQVEAPHGRESHALVELGPRRARKDLDRMAEGDELPGQVTGVDALATTARVPAVDEERHTQTTGAGRCAGRCPTGSAWSCGPS